jgi:membrane peptidoglycan carboxypeptidase
LQSALEHSINTVYAPLGVSVGMNRVVSLAKRSGLQVGHLDRGRSCGARKGVVCPSYSLGIPVSPLSEADAYGTFVDHGVHHAVRSVLSVTSALDGQLFRAAANPGGARVMPQRIADEVTAAMQGVVDDGTGAAARQPFPVYGKTGTTDHFTDAWFTGCTRTLCITVWMGDDKPHPLRDASGREVFGGTIPAELFARVFTDYRSLQQPTGQNPVSPTSSRPTDVVATPTGVRSRRPRPTRTPDRLASTSPKPSTSTPSTPTARPSPTKSHGLLNPP